MDNLNQEVFNVQNPAIGAAILWRFVCGHYQSENKPVPFPLLFVVLPVILRQDMFIALKGTNKPSGLPKVSEKLFKTKTNDAVHYVNNTAIQMRALTLESFAIASNSHLISMSSEDALVLPLTTTSKSLKSTEAKALLNTAEKLGIWCSALSLLEIANWLKVRF